MIVEDVRYCMFRSQIANMKKSFFSDIREVMVSIVTLVIANGIVFILSPKPSDLSFILPHIYITVLIVLSFIGIRSIIFKSKNPEIIEKINDISKSSGIKRNICNEILKNELKDFEQQITEIFTSQGGILSSKNAKIYYQYLYDRGGKEYYSTDLHIPSQHMDDQKWSLDKQTKFQNSNKCNNTRILILEKDDLKYDYVLHSNEFKNF